MSTKKETPWKDVLDQKTLMQNATFSSNPEYNATMVILASMVSAQPFVKGKNEELIKQAREMAKDLIKEFT